MKKNVHSYYTLTMLQDIRKDPFTTKVLDAMVIKLSTKGDSISKICQNVISKY